MLKTKTGTSAELSYPTHVQYKLYIYLMHLYFFLIYNYV